jgi:hypothetical protein
MSVPANIKTAIKAIAVAVTLLFLPLSAGLAIHAWLRTISLALPPYLIAPFALVVSVMGLVPWTVCAVLAVGALAVIVSWRWVQRPWLQWVLAAGLMAMVAFPLLYRYQPAVMAAPGHELILLTAPDSFCDHVRRRSEVYWEMQPCRYEIIGWDETETLFYTESCGDAPAQLLAYNPDLRTPPAPVDAVPETLYPIVSDPKAIDYVRADVYPPSAEESVRRLSFPQPWIISPTGRWVAAVTRHVYGPEDVIVVSTQ